jgi:hypothetical protein
VAATCAFVPEAANGVDPAMTTANRSVTVTSAKRTSNAQMMRSLIPNPDFDGLVADLVALLDGAR